MNGRKRPNAHGPDGSAKHKREDTEALEVVSRIAPYTGTEVPCFSIIDDTHLLCSPPVDLLQRNGQPYSEKVIDFAAVLDEDSGQRSVFRRCGLDMVRQIVHGKNALLFAYGVTGSGKTYTMLGNPQNAGILPRTLDTLFNSIDNQMERCVFYPTGRNGFAVREPAEAAAMRRLNRDADTSREMMDRATESAMVDGFHDDYCCAVFVSYVEIYNNDIFDLLDESGEPVRKSTRMDSSGQQYVDGVNEVETHTADDAFEMFCRGNERRRIGQTLLNRDSSRSHSIFTIRLVQSPCRSASELYPSSDPSRVVVSQLSLVDLAGSERAKRTGNTGDRLAEASNINKSLMVLRQCIDKLRNNQRRALQETVPYRDSKLTMLFKNFFEGTGKVRMIINLNPRPSDYEENLNVLSFAEESQSVRVATGGQRLLASSLPQPPAGVPRAFYAKWNSEMDRQMTQATDAAARELPPPLPTIDLSDEDSWRRCSEALKQRQQYREQAGAQLEEKISSSIHSVRDALCLADYRGKQLLEAEAREEEDAATIAKQNAVIKQLKRQVASLTARVEFAEEEDAAAADAEARLRRSQHEQKRKLKKSQAQLQQALDIVQGVQPALPASQSSSSAASTSLQHQPSVAELRKQFNKRQDENAPPRGRAAPASAHRGREQDKVGVYNAKYRRSQSAPRVLDHQPLHRVPTGGVMRAKIPGGAKHTTKPEVHHLQQASEYLLTHQEVDGEGNISTSVVKGDVIPTAGGGSAVLFNDVERVTHESPVAGPSRPTRL